MHFLILPRLSKPPSNGIDTAYLVVDRWNDWRFVTMFYLYIHDKEGNLHDIGQVKIGFKGQTEETSTYSTLESGFQKLSDSYFSVGQDVSYYKEISSLNSETKKELLEGLRDITFLPHIIESIENENVFSTSLLRSVGISTIQQQFARVLDGLAELTKFHFIFIRPENASFSEIELDFSVLPESKPSTNIHAIIGRNGAGKTTILNNMIDAITNTASTSSFYDLDDWQRNKAINYFSWLVSISFSAFDPFLPPQEQADSSLGTCYSYIGLKKTDGSHKTLLDLHDDFISSLGLCLSSKIKRDMWLKTILELESDENFASMNLHELETADDNYRRNVIRRMSSGHAIIMLIITQLVARVEEKTLIIIDEPESHLHPPLLSAFVRALSELLYSRNGVAIIATHSPVVLQEVPKTNVWKIYRCGTVTSTERPDIETFGQSISTLTRDVFGLEVAKSGFNAMLEKSVADGGSYDEIVKDYNNQLGMEARAVLKVLVTDRDRRLASC